VPVFVRRIGQRASPTCFDRSVNADAQRTATRTRSLDDVETT
jgi:hypothetical protein